jgi:U3 small nucleolar RNA-associated protein 14
MKPWIGSALVAAIVSAIISGIISVVGADINDSRSKLRQARIEEVLKFTASDDQLLITSGKYIKDIVGTIDPKDDAGTLRTEIGRQIRRAEDLKDLFHDKDVASAIVAYQQALISYDETTKEATDPTKMRVWAEKLGEVTDKRRELTDILMRHTKLSS